jgi:hypothetical protein
MFEKDRLAAKFFSLLKVAITHRYNGWARVRAVWQAAGSNHRQRATLR